MIMSGWILPDLHEVKCRSCSTSNGHVEVVKRYLENLKHIDKYTYNKILTAFNKSREKIPLLGLDDFAVIKLGWLKVNDEPTKIIFYTDTTDFPYLIKKYSFCGYNCVVLLESKPIINVDISSHKLI